MTIHEQAYMSPSPNHDTSTDHGRRLAAARSVLAELRAVAEAPLDPSGALVSLGIEDLDDRLAGGLKRAGVHEVFSADIGDEAAASGFAAGLCACAAREKPGPVLWIDTSVSVNEDGLLWPPGLVDWGIASDRLIRATARQPRDALRMADDALACKALGAIVLEVRGPAPMLDLTALRRLHLGAEAHAVPCFLLRFGAEPIASPALTRWSIAARPSAETNRRLVGHPRFGAELARHRGGGLGSWCLEWCPYVQSFVSSAVAEISEPAIPPVQHRPHRTTFAAGAADQRRYGVA